ncbi:MAG: hypothetical protein HYZ54_03090 [Ignavibacteriae bacterium]|nr:hypothetical protein [Ignavibacteriota bacterium]
MMTLEENSHNTWFFFQIHGLHMKSDENWRKFMFGDATIANGSDIKKYLIEIKENLIQKLPEKNQLSEDPGIMDFRFPDENSFIVVSVNRFFTDEKSERIKEEAVSRSHQIIGLVYFYFLFASYLKSAISLTNEIYSYDETSTYRYYNSEGYWGELNLHTKGEYVTFVPTPNFVFYREALLKELNKAPYSYITNIIVEKKSKHFNIIGLSLENFYRTSNVPSPITQQLGSVTSIELLLSDNSQKYGSIENRIRVLLGEEIFNDFVRKRKVDNKQTNQDENEGVLEKRHSAIHEGSKCDANDAFRAMNLYCMVLMGYSKICSKFTSKKEIGLYLDLIYKYTYDEDIKGYDTLNIKKEFENDRVSLEEIDWVVRNLINRFQLCNRKTPVSNENFVRAVYYLKGIRKLNLKDAFQRICYCIYYNTIPINSFENFELEYNQNLKNYIKAHDDNEISKYKV